GPGELSPGFSLGGVILRACPRKGAGQCRGNPYRPHPNSDDYLLRPFRAGRVYCNATQAKAWARFPKPFGPTLPALSALSALPTLPRLRPSFETPEASTFAKT